MPAQSVAASAAPVQAPPAQVPPSQGTAVPHEPSNEHVCTPFPEHRVDAGEQTPLHTPLMQAWFTHGGLTLQSPQMPGPKG